MRKDKGAALLVVVLLVALLAVIVLEFQRRARVDLHAAQNLHDDLQAHALLRSGSSIAEQVLAIYAKNSIADMKSSATLVKGGDLLWKFLFEAEPVAIPAPSEGITGVAGLRARLHDLFGCFPLGALAETSVAPRQQMFKYFLAHVKEYLASRDDKRMENVDPEEVAEAILERLDSGNGQAPLETLAELSGVEGLTSEVLQAIRPFLDVRKEWKFNANARCVPLIMTMQTKTIDEAMEIRNVLRDDPVPDDRDLANAPELGGLSPEFAGSLTTKSARIEVLLEAEVNGGVRRARAIFKLPTQGSGAGATKFHLAQWEEGWVEDEIGTPEPPTSTPKGTTP